jgi:hypothetical protein
MDSTATTPQSTPSPSVPLNVSDGQTSALLDDTIALLGQSLPTKADAHATAEIDRWEAVLDATERAGLAKITQELGLLRQQLNDPETQPHDLAETLASLGAETAKAAEEAANDYTAPLQNLSKLLIKAGSSLSR